MSHNSLTGQIPAGFGQNIGLDHIYLEGNAFTGSLDGTFCVADHPFENLVADCQGPTPEIECTCCTLCCSLDGLACAPYTQAPVASPTLPPAIGQSRFDLLIEILAPLSPAEVFSDPSSPQYKAAWWLATSDGLVLDFETTAFDEIAQRYTMATLFYALDGENWEERNGYVTSLPTCQWGRTFCNEEGLVTKLDLAGNSLAGSIPQETGFFPNMQDVRLEDNSLTGMIPSTILQMTQMTHLSLANNSLVGQIPTEIGQLGLCQSLYLCT